MTTRAEKVAQGRPDIWEETFTHPRHGELTFRAPSPKAADQLRHSVEMDNYLADLGPTAEPRGSTMLLAAAIAGLKQRDEGPPGQGVLVQLPVIGENRSEEQGSGKVTVERVYYDAEAEQDVSFLAMVWGGFSLWRQELLMEVDAVKGPSGETSGDDSNESSSGPTVSPSTIPA